MISRRPPARHGDTEARGHGESAVPASPRPPVSASPEVEIITIGDELLLGETIDRNAAWLGQRLATAGIRVARRATVGDEAAAIRGAVADALARTGTVLCTGGLGPTRDDLTKPAVAELFARPLVLDAAILASIRQRFEQRGLRMPEVNRTQAEVPEGATVFTNTRGTAPGLALRDAQDRVAILLPGVPRELHALVDEHVLAFLLERFPARGRPIRHRVLRTTGMPESALAERVDDVLGSLAPLRIAFLPSLLGVDLRITSWGALEEPALPAAFDAAERVLCARLGDYVYGRDDEDLADVVAQRLTERGLTLALAESCTGGLVSKRLTDRAGASAFLLASVIPYANATKETLLGVQPATLAAHGAVSAESARELALGAQRATGAHAALAITGIAGPTGGTPAKPVGTVWVAAALHERVETRHFRLPGDRSEIRERAAQAALALLLQLLREAPP